MTPPELLYIYIYAFETRTWELNPYKKGSTFLCSVVDQGVHRFFFYYRRTYYWNKTKQVCYKMIFISSLFIIWFLKVFNIVGKKKCGHLEKSCELKQLHFLRDYFPQLSQLVKNRNGSFFRDKIFCKKSPNILSTSLITRCRHFLGFDSKFVFLFASLVTCQLFSCNK